ncbi:hypothetical protein G6F43_008533 [Rhizopus delemar]|nr:hypothetical protein G6F43_008533 [Rhizopus delemar]
MNEVPVDIETNAESYITLSKSFKSFQQKYLIVFTIVMGADWLQGPYLYMLYQSYGLGLTQIATLFLTGFVSSAFAGTAVGSLADTHGRKRICIIYCFTMISALFLRLVNIYYLLFCSHVLSGLSTALHYSVFESWYVSEHTTRGYPSEWRARTFALSTFLNSISAILAGILSNALVDIWGYKAPYFASIILLCTVCTVITSTWTENYGSHQKEQESLGKSLSQGIRTMLRSRNIVVIAAAQTLFECSMYIFVLLYTPAIEAISESTAAYHIFEFTTGLYYPSISSLKADSIPEETRAVIMTLIRIPMNLGVGVIIWQLRGYILGQPCYVIEKVACLSFDEYKACRRLNLQKAEEQENPQANPAQPPVKLTQSSSFITKIKSTFSKKKEEEILENIVNEPVLETDEVIIDDIEIPTTTTALPLSSSISSSTATSSFEDNISDQNDEEDVLLEARLIRQIVDLFSRSMFVFSNTFDLTNNFQNSYKNKIDTDIPLWKRADRRFWWNEHIVQTLVDQSLDEWITPIVQGTIQIEPCVIDGYEFDFILISRRSKERAGMRYQRRGVNEDGEVSNFVETEQIVIFKRNEINHVASFIQTRGSIPLFWSQSPYSLHPIPTLERTEKENERAFQRHFEIQEKLYGRQIVVNLTELVGREAIIGSEYRKHVENFGDPNIKYVEFDFHKETKGMKYENISKLSNSLYDDMTKLQYFWIATDGSEHVYCEQSGVFRTNCMDCLDRTNVVQSAFGRSMLNLQLMRFGIIEYPDKGIKYYDGFEKIFNNVWANNGDAISRMTGKRNFTGMMNDASNSLTRMYFNTVKDFWKQATIDFVLGYHKCEIFRYVPQSTKMSAEPGVERRWEKIRSDAIETSSQIVIADDETKIAGWTLLSPTEPSKISYNYSLEKVVQFRRLELGTIKSIQMGEYILSSLTMASRDEEQNYGFIIDYSTNGETTRWNTGSILNQVLDDLSLENGEDEGLESTDHCLAIFKAVRYNVLGELDGKVETCKKQVENIVKSIAIATGNTPEDPEFITNEPIIRYSEKKETQN